MVRKSLKAGIDTASDFFEDLGLENLKTEFVGKIVTLFIAALSLIAALAWEDVLQSVFEHFFGTSATLLQKVAYTIIVTLFAVIVSVILGRWYLKKQIKVHTSK